MTLDDLHEMLRVHGDRRIRLVSRDGRLDTRSHAEVHADVTELVGDLRDCGIGAGDLVGIAGPNSYEWILADLALLAMGCVSVAVPVPSDGSVDPTALTEAYPLNALLLTDGAHRDDLPPEAAVLGRGRPSLRRRSVVTPRLPGDVFTVAFSSGTSGTTKGLLISRTGVANTVRRTGRAWEVTDDDDVLIVMPFSSLQQRVLLYLAIWFGFDATVVAPERMFQQLRRLAPTIFIGPPSFFEIVENRIGAATAWEALPATAAAVVQRVPGVASQRLRARLGHRWTGMYGPRARLLLTGSAPVPVSLVALFDRLGRPLHEIYGVTEVGWVAANRRQAHRAGTAGRPVDGIEVTLADDGEVLVRAPEPQCLGYIFAGVEEQETVFRPDGLVATGDLGRFDEDGYLHVIGRKKNVIVSPSGVKVSPEELEREIEAACPGTTVVVVTDDRGRTLTCVVWLDDDGPEATAAVESRIRSATERRPPAPTIEHVVFRPVEELTPASGLLTRNHKIDRTAVVEHVFPTGVGPARS